MNYKTKYLKTIIQYRPLRPLLMVIREHELHVIQPEQMMITADQTEHWTSHFEPLTKSSFEQNWLKLARDIDECAVRGLLVRF
jgi:hypothetical protein